MRRSPLLSLVLALAFAAPAHAAPDLVKLGDFDQPTYATSAPGDGDHVYVVEKPGTIRIAGQAAPFLDVTADTLSSDTERGLLSMAFAPDYATSGRFYVYLTAKPDGAIQIRSYQRSAANPYAADPASGRTLISIPHPDAANHNGGQLQFGPDGTLYAGTGDGGGGNDQYHHSQDMGSLLGKLLTLDTTTGAATIVARGLRNPWRFSFDRASGQLVIGDVGQDTVEEIDAGLASNYGWPCKEGTRDNVSDPGCAGVATAPPVLQHAHSEGFCSIVGGYVVRDPGLPTLNGRYLYGDYCDAPLRSADLANPASDGPIGLSVPGLDSFGQDACGRILVVSLNGPVYRLVDGALSACGGSAPAPVDTTPPKLSVHVTGRRHRLSVALKANEACRVTLRAAHFRTRTVSLPAGRRTVVRLRTKHARRGRLTLRITAVDAARNTSRLIRHLRVH